MTATKEMTEKRGKPEIATSALESMSPAAWGLPEKFDAWRPGQAQIVEDIVDCQVQFKGSCVPAGVGKTVAYTLAAKLAGARTCILTATKGLQNQIEEEFSPAGLVSIKGKSNYDCVDRCHLTCEEAWAVCKARDAGECTFQQANAAACKAPLVSTNFACWLNRNKAASGAFTRATAEDATKPFDMLVIDEAHKAMSELASFIAVDLSHEDIERYIKSVVPKQALPMDEWKSYAARYSPILKRQIADADEALRHGVKMDDRELKEYNRLVRVQSRLDTLAKCRPDMWTVEPYPHGFKFDPVWPGVYAKDLFQDIPKVVLMSATIRPKTLTLLGLKPEQFVFDEYPSPFNPNDAPIYHIPTARIWHGSTAAELNSMYARIDEILADRLDRKGLIHSVSYKRAQEIMRGSRHRRYMMTNSRGGPPTADVVADFFASAPPTYLVSPSVVAGYDFSGPACEVNLIPKLSVPDQRSAIMQERLKRDPEYGDYLTIQDLVQACGRGNRFVGDRCQTFITDDSIRRYVWRNRRLFPRYFFDFFRTSGAVPRPLPKMPRSR